LRAPPGQSIITRYQRDPAGRLLQKQVAGHVLQADGSLQPQHKATRYAYDAAGRLISATNDGGAQVALAYDALGQLTGESRTGQGLHSRIGHQYDALGNRTQTTLPDGRQINWLYYGSGHLHQVNLDGQVISDLERDQLHRETGRTQGALISRYGYDALGRLTAQAAWTAATEADKDRPNPWTALEGPSTLPAPVGNPFLGRRYQYDLAGNLISLQDRRTGDVRYGYDKIRRILSAVQPGLQEKFAFDPAHNLIDP
jgi:YD repeat-containing protein